jgi:creatinine amidohydrolase
VQLDRLTWPEVRDELARGRDTVVIAFGATEQHGEHMVLATDAVLGDELARRVAERLGAFCAPTVRVGCSRHHLAFPGTLSVEESTFRAVVSDLVRSLARGGFRRVVLLATHGGNFAPLGAAVESLGDAAGIEVVALSDVSVLLRVALAGESEHGVPLPEGGLHAGEWETSLLLACRPELVHMERARAGYTGDPQAAIGTLFDAGVETLSDNGVIGDPARASAAHGERYWELVVELVIEAIEAQSARR